MTLRSGLIETMASTLYKRVTAKELNHGHHMAGVWRNDAEAVLDAALTYLSGNADEWTVAAEQEQIANMDRWTSSLIAVLQDDPSSSPLSPPPQQPSSATAPGPS